MFNQFSIIIKIQYLPVSLLMQPIGIGEDGYILAKLQQIFFIIGACGRVCVSSFSQYSKWNFPPISFCTIVKFFFQLYGY